MLFASKRTELEEMKCAMDAIAKHLETIDGRLFRLHDRCIQLSKTSVSYQVCRFPDQDPSLNISSLRDQGGVFSLNK
jgi:hypothetical protein